MNNASEDRYINIIGSIAQNAITKVPGILSDKGASNSKLSGVSYRRKRNFNIYIDEGKVVIDIYLNVSYGFSVPEVACNVQETVKSEIEAATSFTVEAINVNVSGVVFKL